MNEKSREVNKKNEINNCIGTIIGNNNKQTIIFKDNPSNSSKNHKQNINIAVATLISFAKNHYAKYSWGSIFSIKDKNGHYPNCDVIIRDIFSKTSSSEYKTLFKTIKSMYQNQPEKEIKNLKEVFQSFGINYDEL